MCPYSIYFDKNRSVACVIKSENISTAYSY